MKYGDKIIKMEGVIVELCDGCIAIDLKGRLGYLKAPMRMIINEHPLKVGQEVAWDMSFVEQLANPEVDVKPVENLETVKIPLDVSLSPADNANKYFKEYKFIV